MFRESRLPGATRDRNLWAVMLTSHSPAAEETLDNVLLLLLLRGVEQPKLSPSLLFEPNILKTKVSASSALSPTSPTVICSNIVHRPQPVHHDKLQCCRPEVTTPAESFDAFKINLFVMASRTSWIREVFSK